VNDVITPFRIDLSEVAIDDLRERLRRTRWPEPGTAGGWSQGTPLAWVRELCQYRLEDYDFAAARERLNRFPQFRTAIDGLGICFVHVRSPHPGAVPLILTHGWPGSVVEFRKVTGPLVDPVAQAGTRPTRSTSCARRCPASGSAASRPSRAGTWPVSPTPGTSS